MKVYIGGYPDKWYNRLFKWYPEPTVYVKVDRYDTWSMDHTLAHICLPMLKQLRDTTHGSPFVEFEDRPEHLIGTTPTSFGDPMDEFHHDAWYWCLEEMMFAFESKIEDENNWRLQHEEWERIQNGFRLFGKYFQNLWD